MSVSIVIPFFNEQDSVLPVLEEVRQTNPGAIIIAVDDGSRDRTQELIASRQDVDLITYGKNLGQSAALYAGLMRVQTPIAVTMDGDGQNDPSDITKLVAMLADCDLACGYRARREDSWARRIGSKIGNGARRNWLNDPIRDTGCTLKAMKREHLGVLIPFNGLHRYFGACFATAGLRVTEIPVNHRPRTAGISKYTLGGRAFRGVYDLIGVKWLLNRRIVFPR